MKLFTRCLSAALTALLLSACAAVRPVSGGIGRESSEVRNPDDPDSITVCVDPGHGFDDIGTDSELLGTYTEKDITLSVALALKEELEQKGIRVVLTHDGVTFPKTVIDDGNNLFNPQERISYADTQPIDYFVSIHCDSYAADSSVNGTRIYYCKGTGYEKDSGRIADKIRSAVNRTFPEAKKAAVRAMENENAYYVIRNAAAPSSLIEIGFVTNPNDAGNMLNEEWRAGLAAAIAEGIADFFAQ